MKKDNQRSELDVIDSLQNPSTRKMFRKFATKPIGAWNQVDFLGWYLSEYKRQLKKEDRDFTKSNRLDLRMFGPIGSMIDRLGKDQLRKYISFAIGRRGEQTSFYAIMARGQNAQLLSEFGAAED